MTNILLLYFLKIIVTIWLSSKLSLTLILINTSQTEDDILGMLLVKDVIVEILLGERTS